nr:hypothetical protein [Tanacetum cinerariifolium]
MQKWKGWTLHHHRPWLLEVSTSAFKNLHQNQLLFPILVEEVEVEVGPLTFVEHLVVFGDGVLVEPAVVLVDPSSASTGRTALAVESVFEDGGIKKVNLVYLLYTEKDDKLVAMAAWTQEVACLCLSEETLNCSSDGISLLSDDEAS